MITQSDLQKALDEGKHLWNWAWEFYSSSEGRIHYFCHDPYCGCTGEYENFNICYRNYGQDRWRIMDDDEITPRNLS